jgi:UDP-4-amino-4,6-dideoxy-N-acetyl-beta-L-altrosamine N-acetyltransferase
MYELRPMSDQDLELVLSWRNDPRVRDNMYTNHVITGKEHQLWFDAASRDPSKRLLMCVDESGVPVGVVTFSDIDQVQKRATWAFYSGSDRRGIGSEMERLALDYAFGDLGLEKLNCEVISFNMPVIEFHRKYGFRVEGIFRSQYRRDGAVYDVYRLAHFRKAWLDHVRPAMVGSREGSASQFRSGASHREPGLLTRDVVVRFADVSGDNNPVHLDDAAARAAGFEGVLTHGMLVAAGISRILGTVFPGAGTVYLSQSLEFLRPIYPDTPIEYFLRIVSKIGRRAVLTTTVFDSDGKAAVTGEAEVLLPKTGVS